MTFSLLDWFAKNRKDPCARVLAELELLRADVTSIKTFLENRIMATLDETLAAVQAEKTADDSIIALLAGLKQQLADALANANLSPENQAKVDAIFAQATDNAAEINAALQPPTP